MIIIRIFLTLFLTAILMPISAALVRLFIKFISGGRLFSCDDFDIPAINAQPCNHSLESIILLVAIIGLFIIYYISFSKLLGKFIK